MRPKISNSRSTPSQGSRNSWPIILVCALILLWSVTDVIRSYPDHFFPRFWDEAIYAMDAQQGAMFRAFQTEVTTYGPAKLGYGLPLAAAVSVFGADGAMYLSTLCWFLIIAFMGWVMSRHSGITTAAISCAFLAYSPLFGKYVAEAGPTLLAGLGFVALWAVQIRRRFWLTGLITGCIAFVDFK